MPPLPSSTTISEPALAVKPDTGAAAAFRLPNRLPTLIVFGRPEDPRCRMLVENAARLRVATQLEGRAVGDVAEVTEQRALVAFFDLGVEFPLAAHGVEEVPHVHQL